MKRHVPQARTAHPNTGDPARLPGESFRDETKGVSMGVKVRERPRGSGIWWIFIDHQGTRKAKKVGRDKRTASEAAKKIEAKLTLGDMGLLSEDKITPTFGEYATQWMETHGAVVLKYSTAESYRNDLRNHVLPFFAKMRLDEITRADVKRFLYLKQKEDLAAASVRKHLAYFSNIMSHAVDDEIIKLNPAQKLSKIVPRKDRKADINPLNREEMQVLLETVKELNPRYYPFFLCAARTGMRLGELLGLEWSAVDFHGRFIEVRQAFSRHRLTTPKNKRIRRVDMSRQLTEELKALKATMREESFKRGEPMPKWVFCQTNGKPLTATSIANRIFHRCLDRAGLRRVRFHDIRHSYASILVEQGESLAYVKEQMGHHSIQITVDIYAHLAPAGNKSAVDRLDDHDFLSPKATIRNLSATA
jgi:integrase